MRMHPYLKKPWRTKSKKRLMATFTIHLIVASGFSFFLISGLEFELLEAALIGAGLFLILFLMANFCVWFKASRVQALNETISIVA